MQLEEKLARALCDDADPEEILIGPHHIHGTLAVKKARWKWKLGQAHDFLIMMEIYSASITNKPAK